MTPSKLESIEKRIGYVFRDKGLLRRALTHSSRAYEVDPEEPEDNELLEFLGDSVLGLITAEFYFQAFPDRSEGELSKLKSSSSSTLALSRLAERTRLDKAILLGKGEEKSGGRRKKNILAGAFEALIAGVYLDGGLDAVRAVLEPLLRPSLKSLGKGSVRINNCKSALQEMFQKAEMPAPVYRLVSEKGPAHDRTFVVEVLHQGKPLARGRGNSKKIAEQKAAEKALKRAFGRRMKVLSPEAFIIDGF
jgi:ribonuclease-3